MAEKLIYQLNQLHKEIDGLSIVNIDSLTITSGEFIAIIGPSGAGKSTLLRILHFLDTPSSGTLSFMGKKINGKQPPNALLRRNIGTVFQRPELLEGTVYKNVEFSLTVRGVENPDRITNVLNKLDLTHLANIQSSVLSGGEMQRVALARVLVYEPDILLLDEPTANLDPYNVELIERIIKEQQNKGKTILLVTHNIFQARRLAQRVGLMLKGQLVEISETEKFFSHPDDPRATAFINGDMIY